MKVPFGTWRSPLTPPIAARGGVRFAGLAVSRDREGRPLLWYSALEDGHNALWVTRADGTPRRVRAVDSARSRVNEYGGGAFWVHGESLFWVEDDDQRIRRVDLGDEDGCLVDRGPVTGARSGSVSVEGADLSVGGTGPGVELVEPPPQHRSTRYAAGVVEPGGTWMVTERELHLGSADGSGGAGAVLEEPINDLVWLPTGLADRHPSSSLPAGVRSIVAGADFSVAPAMSGDGRHLAWLQWNHPDMPWDAAELWAGRIVITADGPALEDPRRVAGGAAARGDSGAEPPVAVCFARWDPEGRLWWCDDRDDLWALRRVEEPGLPRSSAGDVTGAIPTRPLMPPGSDGSLGETRETGDTGDTGDTGETGEVGAPRWVSGTSRHGFVGDEVILVETVGGLDTVRTTKPSDERSVLDGTALMESPGWVDTLVVVDPLVVADTTGGDGRPALVALVAGSPTEPTAVVCAVADARSADTRSADARSTDARSTDARSAGGTVRASRFHSEPWPLGARSISVPEPVTFATGDRRRGSGDPSDVAGEPVAHGLFYPPVLEGVSGPPGELPPLVVRIHGGPTAAARAELSASVQFWTTRGFAVIEVNYRGSTGFGRAYRDSLRGGWGEVEVADCIAAAEHLGSQGRVDPRRCVIRGGSAGGFTALEAVAAEPTGSGFHFAAATSLYGVTDLMTLATDTHKFESRYLDGLIGPLPEAESVYRRRSPLDHPERISSPVLILQGLDDPVVPPSQAEVLVRGLADAGIDHEYRTYPGEGHGFRREATIVDALQTELAFYQRVLDL